MSPLDDKTGAAPGNGDGRGVWKSGRGKGRRTPKGRQLDDAALAEVRACWATGRAARDLLIEHLHLIQDAHGHLSAAHLRALAEEMRLAQAEVYEVATFYAHFDVVKEGETPPPALTIRVCDSLSCELAGAQALKAALEDGLDPAQVRVLRAPCMGRCDTAPVLELGHHHIDHATPETVHGRDRGRATPTRTCPDYEDLDAYRAERRLRRRCCALREGGDWEAGAGDGARRPGCAAWAARASRRAGNGASCAPSRGRATLPSTATRASRAPSRTATTSSARRTCSSRGC